MVPSPVPDTTTPLAIECLSLKYLDTMTIDGAYNKPTPHPPTTPYNNMNTSNDGAKEDVRMPLVVKRPPRIATFRQLNRSTRTPAKGDVIIIQPS
jgi:hypothetical protein